MLSNKNQRTARERRFQHSGQQSLLKYNYGNGAGWATKRELRKKNKGKGQTPGKMKSEFCQADSRKKFFAKSSRSYKHKNYSTWLAWARQAATR